MTTLAGLADTVWTTKYRWQAPGSPPEASIDDTWRRVASALAAPEIASGRARHEAAFVAALDDFRFLPGGRVLAGAGTGTSRTLFNCFVIGGLDDAPELIMRALDEAARTLTAGGGIGCDFSALRPAGAPLPDGGRAAGPVVHMKLWDAMCAALESGSARRGAMLAALRCDHPDIESFIDAKRTPGELRHFNLSVLVTDAFMQAVERDAPWSLAWNAAPAARTVRARSLWERIARRAWEAAEPGILFIDRIRAESNLAYCERIEATNPCGEVPLPAWGACDLGSLNLPRFVIEPFGAHARLDVDALRSTVAAAVRMLDNVYEVSGFPLERQREVALRTRRLGIGLTGLADSLIMLGLRYDTSAARELAARTMREICLAAYGASIALARERGAFPEFRASDYLRGGFAMRLPRELREAISRHGLRNGQLTAIAPTGSISLLAGNVSSGLEPIFAARYQRALRRPDGSIEPQWIDDPACLLWRAKFDGTPPALVTAEEVSPVDQLAMQAALQPWVDNAISKTVTVPADCRFAAFSPLFDRAWRLGLKGVTAYRPNPVTGAVLGKGERCAASSECARAERGD